MRFITLVFLVSAFGISNREVRAVQPNDPTTALVQGNSEFALDLYAKLSQGNGNRFLSPASISTALAMTYAGAQGETARPDRQGPPFHVCLPTCFTRRSTD